MTEARKKEIIESRLREAPAKYRKTYLKIIQGKGTLTDAIKFKCLDCMGWERKEITLCTSPACSLFHHRPFQTDESKISRVLEVQA